jgi:hypothetical protein
MAASAVFAGIVGVELSRPERSVLPKMLDGCCAITVVGKRLELSKANARAFRNGFMGFS